MMTDEGIYIPSKLEDLEEAFEKYCPNKMFLDIGSGNGGVMGLAFKYGSMVRGVEIEKDFYENSQFKGWVYNKDFFKIDFNIYDILYYYMKGSNNEDKLIEKLNNEGRDILILYTKGSNESEISNFTDKLKVELIDNFKNILVYRF